MQFDVFIVDAWATDSPKTHPVKFLVCRPASKGATTNDVNLQFERQGWTVTGTSKVATCDSLIRTAGAPNAGRWVGEHRTRS
jgi:hypothetical protein